MFFFFLTVKLLCYRKFIFLPVLHKYFVVEKYNVMNKTVSHKNISLLERASQPQHRWHFGSDDCSLLTDLRLVGYLAASLVPTERQHPLSPVVTIKNVFRHCHMSPGRQNFHHHPWEFYLSTPVKNHCFKIGMEWKCKFKEKKGRLK